MTRLAYPFAIAPSGRSATVDYASDAQVAQMVRQLVLTTIGERVMRPDLGSPARQMVFAAGNGAVGIALQATLQATIAQWLGHVLVLHEVAVDFGEGSGRLTKKPCTTSQPSAVSSRSVSGFSTPSATTRRLML